MVSVERYTIKPDLVEYEDAVAGEWVRFTDHEAALAAARDDTLRDTTLLNEIRNEQFDKGWNAALDAVLALENVQIGAAIPALNDIAALRKPTPQPEALTREQQNERWRQDYNTQARLRKVDDWRLTEYPKPFEETPAAAQPEPVPHWPCECGSVCSEPAAAQPEEES